MSTEVTTYMLCDERMSSGLAMPPGKTEKPALQKEDMEWNVAKTILSSRAIGRESGMEKNTATAPAASTATVNPST